jgi:hypothetical protein
MYEILPKHAPEMSFNAWGGATTAGTPIKIYYVCLPRLNIAVLD